MYDHFLIAQISKIDIWCKSMWLASENIVTTAGDYLKNPLSSVLFIIKKICINK